MNHKIPFNYCIQTKIFEFLCLKDLLVCRLVCKKWKLFISYFPLKYVMNDNNNIGNIFNGIAYIKFNELFHHIDLKCINCNKLKSLHIRNISTNTVQTIQTIQFPWLTKLEIYFSTCSSLNLNEFQSLKKLKLFDLSQLTDTNFKCTTPPLKQLKISTTPNLNLQFLQNISLYLKQIKLFNMNQIHFNNLQYLQQFQLLTILEISNNDSIIDDDLIQHLPPLHLNELTLSDCNGLHGYFLKTLQSIQHLKLTFDRFLENDCLLLYQWNNSLKTLDIFGSSISILPQMNQIENLSIGHTLCNINNINQFQHLQLLDATYLKLNDSNLQSISTLHNLLILNISFNHLITDSGVNDIIMNCPNLRLINFAHCTKLTPNSLNNLFNLSHLHICIYPNFKRVLFN